jgi:hypothetical protein
VQVQNSNVAAFALRSECGERLMSGATCELDVRFTPTALGAWQNHMLVRTDRGETATVELAGEALGPPHLVSAETSFSFEPLPVGRSAVHRWVVTNDGPVATSLIGVRFLASVGIVPPASDYRYVYDCADGLAPGASCNVDITFAPTRIGNQSGRFNLSAASGIANVGPYEIVLGVNADGI